MNIRGIVTRIFKAGENLADFAIEHLEGVLEEGDVVAVTSKIVSLAENRLINKSAIEKRALIEAEADLFLCETKWEVCITVKHGLLIPSAGVDESNSENECYILYPENPYRSAQDLCNRLKEHFAITNLGVVITDSHSQPLRKGVVGVGLAHWGFVATKNLVGTEDLFGRRLEMTQVNVVDSLSVAAVFVMGEAADSKPLAIVRAEGIVFENQTDPESIQIPLAEDLYQPLLAKIDRAF